MKNIKRFVILHSNDFHGDFFEEYENGELSGGISRLSGYVDKVRKENRNVLYTISGDMFRGSIVDSEYKGISTIELINLISPDAVTIGNHEIDYGIAHLLFIEKMANFPILNANLYIKNVQKRLFKPYKIIRKDGLNILVIGIITEEVIAATKKDELIGALINVEEAAREVERICNNYKHIDIDFTIVLTHIGFEADKELAKLIDPLCGVDLILGGHSHTFLDEPVCVNDIVIAHAGHGSDYIGRFDIDIDTDNNCIDSYTWELIPINSQCPRDYVMEEILSYYKDQLDSKYERLLTKLDARLTHPQRNQETSLGNFFADIIGKTLGVDIMLIGSGSIRGEYFGPVVSFRNLTEIFPYDQSIYLLHLYGHLFRKFILHMLRDDAFEGITEFYQISKGIKIRYERSTKQLLELTFKGKEIADDDVFTVGLQNYHFANLHEFINITYDEAEYIRKPRVISTSCLDLIDEYLSTHSRVTYDNLGKRIIVER